MRWSRQGLDAELRALTGAAALGPHDAPPNLSVVVGEGRGRKRTKHQLSVQGQPACVTSRDGTLVRAVVRALGALATDPPADALAVNAFLLLRPDGGAIAVDRRLAADFRRIEPRLRRSGLRVIEMPRLVLRPATATAALPDGIVAINRTPGVLDHRWPLEGTDDDLTAGEFAVSRFVYNGRRDPESLAGAVGDMVPVVRDTLARVHTADVDRLAAFAARTDLVGLHSGDPSALLDQLTS